MKTMLLYYGFADAWLSCSAYADPTIWNERYRRIVMTVYARDEVSRMRASTKLTLYRSLSHTATSGIALYLDSLNTNGSRIKTEARLGHLYLLTTVATLLGWPKQKATCWLCGAAIETTQHFLQECSILLPCRIRFREQLSLAVSGAGPPAVAALIQFDAGGVEQINLMLDNVRLEPAVTSAASDDKLLREQIGYVRWCVDKVSKNYLAAIWRIREALLGKLRVVNKTLVVVPSVESGTLLLRHQSDGVSSCLSWMRSNKYRHEWLAWAPKRKVRWKVAVRSVRKRYPFYVVWSGRVTGVFYKWYDCWRSVCGLADARYCGVMTLEEAEDVLELCVPEFNDSVDFF
jgi:hypothetical protein